MCIGVPMQVQSCDGTSALCISDKGLEAVDISLVGEQPKDTWLLVFLGAAREVISQERAAQVQQALQAMDAVMKGEPVDLDDLFADLVDKQPELPEHLREAAGIKNH